MDKFDNIEYLKTGNDRQKAVYRILKENQVLDYLSKYSPILTGTIPIEIDTKDSDIDICCYWTIKNEFITDLKIFSKYSKFQLIEKVINEYETVIAKFEKDNFDIEIFGQNRPTKQQESYRHMIIENKILQERGEGFKEKVKKLKEKGIKTEPAFGILLGLNNDPYNELLELEKDAFRH